MKSTFTPAPWLIAGTTHDGCEAVIRHNMTPLCLVDITDENGAANARLIEAAPDLIQAIEHAIQLLPADAPAARILKRAVERATGRKG
jgi:hypothetical protein